MSLVAPDVLAQSARPLPIVTILDVSWTMRHHADRLRSGLRGLPAALSRQPTTRNSGEVAVITMGHDVELRTGAAGEPPFGFARVRDLVLPTKLDFDGVTRLGAALDLAVDVIERRMRSIREAHRSAYRPYVGIVSDGRPTLADGSEDVDEWRRAAERLTGLLGGRVGLEAFHPAGSDRGILPELAGSATAVHEFDPQRFAEVFEAISFSADQHATGQRPLDMVRNDLEQRPERT